MSYQGQVPIVLYVVSFVLNLAQPFAVSSNSPRIAWMPNLVVREYVPVLILCWRV